MFEKSKEISSKIKKLSDEQIKIKIELENILSSIPNIPHHDVPEGKDENDNKIIETKGKINSKILKKNHIMN